MKADLLMTPTGRWALRLGVALALVGGLALWWRFGLPVGMAESVWLCFT